MIQCAVFDVMERMNGPNLLACFALLGVGCTWITQDEYAEKRQSIDADGDGVSPRDGDCRDSDSTVFPGAEDLPYDGIDSDCAGDNDFDFDRDGVIYLDIDAGLVAQYQAEWDTTFTAVFGDCDDTDPTIFPDSPNEVPYDDVDSDCDGGDDFDDDRDGVPFPQDCLDQADPALDVEPALVFPGALDTPYDGIDADCGADNDFDVDRDGYVPLGAEDAYAAFEIAYGRSFGALAGDCDDDNPDFNPAALEVLGSNFDEDCDGTMNNPTFGSGGLTWSGVRVPLLRRAGSHLVLATIADHRDDGSAVADNVVTALTFPDVASGAQGPEQVIDVLGPDPAESLGNGLDLAPDGAGFSIASVDARDGLPTTFTYMQRFEWSGTAFSGMAPVTQSLPMDYQPVQVDLVVDGAERWVWSCGGTQLHATRFSDLAGTVTTATTLSATDQDTCYASTSPLFGIACSAGMCSLVEFDPETPQLLVNTTFADSTVHAHRHGTLLLAVDSAGIATVNTSNAKVDQILTSPTASVRQVDVVEEGGEWFAAAVRAPAGGGPGELVIAWGLPSGILTEYVVPRPIDPAAPDMQPRQVAIEATPTRVAVAVVLEDLDGGSNLLWTFYAR